MRQQTCKLSEIVVVNNGSTDGTDNWLAEQSELTVVTQANLGGAGGFATGIDTVHKAGFDWFWCMDDDCLAAPTALAQLMASPAMGPCIKNSVSVSTTDHSELAFHVDRPNQSYRKVADMTQFDLVYGVASFFNGTLINAKVVEKIGLPDRKLFIWGDEVEYMTRAEKMGFPVVTVPSSVFYHPPSFDRNGIPWPGAWKQYYAVRNQRRILQNIHGGKFGWLLFIHWSLRALTEQMIAKRKNRVYNFLLYGEATIDSLFNYFGKKPNHILTVRLYRLLNK
ncbi:glycosyltransferase [Spirosoma oryzicola]|uniref:Glycosyltransferase n=1 Tax=Spirosoma liriopis TaxID=2937440 RepID=A0ABT0HGZ4_9BACT|nr:glycosyltransferase [Spirosoma oryzicola]MCK8490958.1 glycosyltransferase [Spirosoma liriopis]UHG90342.1 glycosyltransferase [Spirosoma oryzicola]